MIDQSCHGSNYIGEHCRNAGTFFENGYWWCGIHAPSKVEAKRQKRNAEIDRRLAERNVAWDERNHALRLKGRKAELFDMLLAELAEMGLAESLRTKYQALAKES